MSDRESSFEAQREAMVERQLRIRGIRDERVLQAFRDVPRHRFVPEARRHQAYGDHPVTLSQGQTISQPFIVALTTQELAPQPDDRVLDVGSGSGYQAAILAGLVREVHAVERLEELAEASRKVLDSLGIDNVTVHVRDGTQGLPAHAPFDGIVCGAAGPKVPDPWVEQLADGGRIVMPVGSAGAQTLVRVERHGEKVRRTDICPVRFVPLIGEHGWESAG